MTRDPIGFVWRIAPWRHVLALLAVALALPLGWLGLDLVRIAVDEVMAGRAPGARAEAPLLRLAFTLPARLRDAPLVLFEGVSLDRIGAAWAAAAILAGLALAGTLLAVLFGFLEGRIGDAALARLRREALEALLTARPQARDEARQVVALTGEGVARHAAFLGRALLEPAFAGAMMAVALTYALGVGWPLAAALLAGLGLQALLRPAALAAGRRCHDLALVEGAALRRAETELLRRLPAVRAHGTEGFERGRLADEFGLRARARRPAERRAALLAGLSALAGLATPCVVLGAGVVLVLEGRATAGGALAAACAALLGASATGRIAAWRRRHRAAARHLADLDEALALLRSRRPPAAKSPALAELGAIQARGLAAYDAASGARVSGVDLAIDLPAHVALVGDAASGAQVLARLIGGQVAPSSGRLTLGGVAPSEVAAGARARRIAHAGGAPVLVPGTLADNLLYGCPSPDAAPVRRRLVEVIGVVGLDRLAHARGLAGSIDPAREPDLAARIVEARGALRESLSAGGMEALVEPFDRARYNRHATLGKNILFGVPLGDTFGEANLPAHPFLRAILEAEGLTRPLQAMGLAIAASTLDIFADLPDDHPLFAQYALFPARERGYFADLLERQGVERRGARAARDRERLIGLSLRYSESRHRLGLLDAALEARLLAARHAFAALIPASLKPAIEFYDPATITAAASLKDNLLFGRVATDRAGAEAEVQALIRRVLDERGLDGELVRIGLASRVDPRGTDLLPPEAVAVDLARCLMREPELVVLERALDGLPPERAEALVARLRQALRGRSLVLACSDLTAAMDAPPFDAVLRLDRGVVVEQDHRQREAEAA